MIPDEAVEAAPKALYEARSESARDYLAKLPPERIAEARIRNAWLDNECCHGSCKECEK